MKNFKQLRVWQKGLEIALASYELVQAFPKEERYGLSSQITRAAVSIPSNIAEGSSRSSDLDHIRFMEIALGSLFELETQVLISKSLKFGDLEKSNRVRALACRSRNTVSCSRSNNASSPVAVVNSSSTWVMARGASRR